MSEPTYSVVRGEDDLLGTFTAHEIHLGLHKGQIMPTDFCYDKASDIYISASELDDYIRRKADRIEQEKLKKHYVMDGGMLIGLFTGEELLDGWKKGELLPCDDCYSDGMKRWTSIGEHESVATWEEELALYAKTMRETARWRTIMTRRPRRDVNLGLKPFSSIWDKILNLVKNMIASGALVFLFAAPVFGIASMLFSTQDRLPYIILSSLSVMVYVIFILLCVRDENFGKPLYYFHLKLRAKGMVYERLQLHTLLDIRRIRVRTLTTRPDIAGRTPIVVSGHAEVLYREMGGDFFGQYKWHVLFLRDKEGFVSSLPALLEVAGRVPVPYVKRT